jgi:hypothetical protein
MSFTDVSMARKSRPAFIVPLALALLFTFGIGPNFELVVLACVVLIVGAHLLWRPGEAQIMLFIFAYQWLQVTMTLFFANIRGVPVSELIFGYPAMDQAALLVITSLLVLAIGMRLGAGAQRPYHLARARAAIVRVPPGRWLYLHILMWAVSTVSLLLAAAVPGLSQPLIAMAGFKWATFTILTIATFARSDASRTAWLVVFGIEFLSSIGGYFSSFKFVFVFTLIAISAVGVRVSIGQVVGGALTTMMMVTLGLYWTAIKDDYRYFLSGGQQAQVVTVSTVQAMSKIVDLAADVDGPALSNAAEGLANRFAEIDMFSAVLLYVPAVVPHEWGSLWWDAVTRPFMPRILFPDKAIIDESELSQRYTGMRLAGMEQGTQISIGYIAESYVDFSEFGMWGALLIFGYFLGRIYRWCIEHPNGHGILGFGIACATLMQLQSVGFSSAKLVGGILTSVIVAAIALRFVPTFLPWLRA